MVTSSSAEIAFRYGKVFKSHLFGRPVIISTDLEVNKAVLQNDSSTFIPFYPKSVLELMGEYSILLNNGDQHKRLHGLVGGFLKSPFLKDEITKDIQQSVEFCIKSWKGSKQIYIQDETRRITFPVLVKALLSIESGKEMQFLKREFSQFIKGIICVPINLPGTRLHKSLQAKDRMLTLVKRIIEDKIKNGICSTPRDVADVLLKEMTEASGKEKPTVDSICNNIVEMMIPGEDTVPTLMTLAIKFLSDCPSALRQLVEENMQLKKDKEFMDKPYTWSDYLSLSFTNNVINETLRMGNIINGTWRKSLKDVQIKGYLIPKGWCIMTSFTSIHMEEENYENPYDFDPWRWQRKENNLQSAFTPFGGGQRLCPGMELSRLEVAIFLHHFVTNFSWVAEKDTIITFPTVKMKKRLPVTLLSIT
ncbi:3-epi-6-deoxocathasterone 23-monooxygenase-like [Asparagus officinalis]|uniref:3-epi-6-deoxocathasterone 23-monooxygenase-like n=1 Tax=Asparagus officinalis TaxID=4686 RepID=UPI00098E6DA8|nr:3-epi-6-deoxocathasterone 23-monooxygenase-like [Asparagus officinalis]